MQKEEVFDVQIRARRSPRFKAGSDLAKKVNRVVVDVNHDVNHDEEVVSINLKWVSSSEKDDCVES